MGQQNLSKFDWYKKNLRNDFLIFGKNEFPKFTGTNYDPLLFEIINSAYVIKNRMDDFFKALEPSIIHEKNDYKVDSTNVAQLKEVFLKDGILSGLKIFELNPKGNAHLTFLEELGASIPEEVNKIPISGDNAIKLKNWSNFVNEKFDVTFSNGLMDDSSGIKYENHSAVFSGFELYAFYSNITKKNGFSLHANGSIISSLYETYFQFIGFKVIEYFRNASGPVDFTMIMKKINEKSIDYD